MSTATKSGRCTRNASACEPVADYRIDRGCTDQIDVARPVREPALVLGKRDAARGLLVEAERTLDGDHAVAAMLWPRFRRERSRDRITANTGGQVARGSHVGAVR